MRTKWLAALAILLGLTAATWWFASPWWTLRAMRAAAAAHDEPALSAHVDYPALREDLKGELMKQVTADGRGTEGLGSIGAAIATAIAGPIIDAAVTPKGVEAMFRAEEAKDKAASSSALSTTLPRAPDARDKSEIMRDGFDQFRVKGRDPGSATLVFHRDGLAWKLAGIDLPPPSAAATTG